MRKIYLQAVGIPVAICVADLYKRTHRKYITVPKRRLDDVL